MRRTSATIKPRFTARRRPRSLLVIRFSAGHAAARRSAGFGPQSVVPPSPERREDVGTADALRAVVGG
jgi:hypothetical protein